mgnify:CR=1 FL=1
MYFLTLTVVGWVDIFSRKQCKDILIDSLKYCQSNKGLILNAYVIMTNHMHMICMADAYSSGLSNILRDFKKYTSKKLIDFVLRSRKESRKDWIQVILKYHAKYNSNNSRYQVWQQRNRPKILLHPRFTYQKLNYIHNNPVKAGIVRKPEEYVYSSASNYVGSYDNIIDVDIIDYGALDGYLVY